MFLSLLLFPQRLLHVQRNLTPNCCWLNSTRPVRKSLQPAQFPALNYSYFAAGLNPQLLVLHVTRAGNRREVGDRVAPKPETVASHLWDSDVGWTLSVYVCVCVCTLVCGFGHPRHKALPSLMSHCGFLCNLAEKTPGYWES